MEVEKLEKDLGLKADEITEGKNRIEEVEREANQIKAQIAQIKNDLGFKGIVKRSFPSRLTEIAHDGPLELPSTIINSFFRIGAI